MKFSVRVSYPESKNYNWLEAVKTYKEIGFAEVAFLNPELFLNVELKDIIMPLKKQTLKSHPFTLPSLIYPSLIYF